MDDTDAAFSRYLRRQRGEGPLTDDAVGEQDPAGEFLQFVYLVERFNQYSAVLDAVLGADFVKSGPGKRYVHREADLPFVAERFLSSYLLIIAFDDAAVVDAGGAVLELERARSAICDLLEDLPPDGGGDQSVSNAKRLA